MNLRQWAPAAAMGLLSAPAFAHALMLDLDRGPLAFLPNGVHMAAAEPGLSNDELDVSIRRGLISSRTLSVNERYVFALRNPGDQPVTVSVVLSEVGSSESMGGMQPVSVRIPGGGRQDFTRQAAKPMKVTVQSVPQ